MTEINADALIADIDYLIAERKRAEAERDDARAEAERWKSLAMKLMVQAAIIMGEK